MKTVETEKRRFALLDHLNQTGGYELNVDILKLGAQAQGIPTTGDQVRTALAWLEEQELVNTYFYGKMQIAKLTQAGQEVAQGQRILPGVHRPAPEV